MANAWPGSSVCEEQDAEAFWGKDITGSELLQERSMCALLPRYYMFAAHESAINEPCAVPAREVWLGPLISVCVSGT